MSDLLLGQSLVWVAYDPPGVMTATVQFILADLLKSEQVRLRLIRVDTPSEVSKAGNDIGLAIYQIGDIDELQSICESLCHIRTSPNGPICAVLFSPRMIACVPILLESGAQIVTSQLTSLQNALRRAISRTPRSKLGFHPLTAGLVQRLPWPELDNE